MGGVLPAALLAELHVAEHLAALLLALLVGVSEHPPGHLAAAEVAVAAVSAGSLIGAMGSGELRWSVVAAMLLGGVAAAPVAAWMVKKVPARPMGVAVGGLLLLTNARELADWRKMGDARWGLYLLAVVLVVLAGLRPRISESRTPAATAASADA